MSVANHRFDNDKRRRPDHHVRQAMLTPSYILEPVRRLLGGIGLDPCTEPDNPTGAEHFFCLPTDGCAQEWPGHSVFCNPPYGEARNRWVEKCIEVGRTKPVVLLIPSHTETRIFQQALGACTSVLFVQARLRFGVLRENGRQEAASHGSALFGFGVDLSPLHQFGVPMHCSSITRATPPSLPIEYERADAAPPNSLPDWDECAMRVANSDFIAKRVAEGGDGPERDSKLATELHRFIYEYDDADPYRSTWFLHRLEKLINEIKTNASLPIDLKQASEQARGDVHTIEGTVTFKRSDPEGQACVCCPKGGGHIFSRHIKWDAYETNRPEHFGTSANVFVDSRVTDFNKNEGRRVRLTVELLPTSVSPSPHPEEGALLLGGDHG